MSQEQEALSPTRLQIFREAYRVLGESKNLEEAKKKFKSMVLSLVLGEE